MNNSFSTWSDIRSGVPQGSIIEPLLFNIYLNDIFYFLDDNMLASYADNNTPYAIGKNVDIVITKLNQNTETLLQWFKDNYFKMNIEKCHLLLSTFNDDITSSVNGIDIHGNESVKNLSVKIDSKLKFKEHISSLYNKASLKLHAMARISHLMTKDKLRTLIKAFIEP